MFCHLQFSAPLISVRVQRSKIKHSELPSDQQWDLQVKQAEISPLWRCLVEEDEGEAEDEGQDENEGDNEAIDKGED